MLMDSAGIFGIISEFKYHRLSTLLKTYTLVSLDEFSKASK